LAVLLAGGDAMRKLLFLVLALMVSTPAWASINRVQSKANFSGSGTSCQAQFTVNATTTANDSVVVWTAWKPSSGAPTASVADTQGNSYSLALASTEQPTSGVYSQIFFASGIKGGTQDTVTVSYSGSTSSCVIVIVEYSGILTTSALDATVANTGASSSLTSGLATPTSSNKLVFGAGTTDTGAVSAGSGYGTIQSSGGYIAEDSVLISNAQQQATAGSTSSGNWVMQLATFRGSSDSWSGSQTFTGDAYFTSGVPYYDVKAFGASGSPITTTGTIAALSNSLVLGSPADFTNGQGIAIVGAGPVSILATPSAVSVAQSLVSVTIVSISGNGTTATATCLLQCGFAVGQSVTISGNSTSGFNTATAIVGTDSLNTFTYPNTTNGTGTGGSAVVLAGSTTYTYQVAAIDSLNGESAASSASTVTSGPAVLSLNATETITWNCVSNALMYGIYGRSSGSVTFLGMAGPCTNSASTKTFTDYGNRLNTPYWLPTTVPSTGTAQFLVTSISSGAGTGTVVLANLATTRVTSNLVQHDDTVAINSALSAAAATQGGGTVFFPANGAYNFGQLSLPATASNIILDFAGILQPYSSITLNQVGYSLHGAAQGQFHAPFQRGPCGYIQSGNLNPIIRITGTVVGITLSNVCLGSGSGGNGVFGDGILVDSGPSNTTISSVSVGSFSTAVGSPLKLDTPSGGFGAFLDNDMFSGPYQTLIPSIDDNAMGQVFLHNSTILNTGVHLYGPNSGSGSQGTDGFSNILTEDLFTPSFLLLDTTNATLANLSVDHIEMADDESGGGLYLIQNVQTAGSYNIEITNSRGWHTQMVGGQPLAGAFLSGVTTALGQSSDIFQIDNAGDFNEFREGGIGCASTTNVTLTICELSAASPGVVITNASGGSGDLTDWNSFGNTGGNLARIDKNGILTVAKTNTTADCAVNSASPAACGNASSGGFVVPGATTTYTVNTTSVSATSRIFILPVTDGSNLPSSPTCVAPASGAIVQSARSAGVSFTFKLPSSSGTTCFNYLIVN
jgi:hypothetical protein